MGARGDASARPGRHALAALLLAALLLAAFAPGRAACGAALASEAGDEQGDARAEVGSDAGSGSEQGPGQLIDTYMAGHEQDQGLAVMVSVGGGSVVERFYGLADASGGSAVDGQTTFEWGRCSDLLVWVSLMQLAEEGSLSLSSSVEGLLPEGVELPEGYGALDVLDLMDHTSGLDVALNGSRSSIPDGTTSVGSAFSLFSVEPRERPGRPGRVHPLRRPARRRRRGGGLGGGLRLLRQRAHLRAHRHGVDLPHGGRVPGAHGAPGGRAGAGRLAGDGIRLPRRARLRRARRPPRS